MLTNTTHRQQLRPSAACSHNPSSGQSTTPNAAVPSDRLPKD